jgi:restriction-modification enzyme MmeI-like protein
MGKLHDHLKEQGYKGHKLEIYLVHLVFCLFADDTGIFEKDIFHDYLKLQTREDDSHLALHIAQLFQVLNMDIEKRQKHLNEALAVFPYVDGKLFEENL